MRQLVAVRPRPPHTRSACSWRCPTTHVPLARRSHTHTQCPPMSMPHHPRASRRAPPPVSHTQCLPHGDPQPHVLLAARPRPSHIRSAYPPRSTTASRHTPPPEQNPRHSRPCAPARAAERRQHRAHRHEWHDDTARQKREHRTLASKAGRLRAASKGEPAQLSRPAGLKSDNTIFMIITVTACDRAAHFSHGVLPCLIARVLTTLTTCNNLTVDLQACNGSIL